MSTALPPTPDAAGAVGAAAAPADYTYDVFISYRHVEPDRRWAHWLHTQLEAWRTPKRLVQSRGVVPRLRRAFRDEEELAASADLSASIERALARSRFLIVVCSPRTPQSEWVNKEVSRFREMGRGDRILALLVEGEPADSFPLSLREIRPAAAAGLPARGPVTLVEPLAADVRPETGHGGGHGRRMAMLRLMATVLGVTFDDLRQREQERRIHRLAYLGAALGGLLVVVSGLAVAAVYQRGVAVRQKAEAVSQRQRADAMSGQLAVKADEARREADNARKAQSVAQTAQAAAERSEAAAQRGLADVCVDNGTALWAAGDPSLAILWFVRALEAESNDPVRQTQHRIRIATTLRQFPRPLDVAEPVPSEPRPKLNGREVFARHPLFLEGKSVSSDPKAVVVVDAATNRQIGAPIQFSNVVGSFPLSPDGTRLTTACWDGTARVWETATGKPVTPVMRHGSVVSHVAFSPDGKKIATASEDRTARVWDAATGEPSTPPMEHGTGVRSVQFSPDGGWLLTTDNDGARLWAVADGKPTCKPIPQEARTVRAAFIAGGPGGAGGKGVDRVLTWGGKTARVWDARTGEPASAPMGDGTYNAEQAAASADGRRVLTYGGGRFRAWDAKTGKPLTPAIRITSFRIERVGISPDGRRAWVEEGERPLRVWDIDPCPRAGPADTWAGGPEEVKRVAFTADGRRGLTVAADQSAVARVWDVATGRPIAPPIVHPMTRKEGALAADMTAAFSPDGRRVVTAGVDHAARVWDAATGLPACPPLRLDDRMKVMYAAAFSPDGSKVVTGGTDGTARVWDAATGRALTPPLAHGDTVNDVRFVVGPAGAGDRILTGSSDATARVWDVATGKQVLKMSAPFWVLRAAQSPDGRRFVTGTWDGHLQAWDAADGRRLWTAVDRTTSGRISDLSIGPDGTRVATADSSGPARVWDALTGEPVTAQLTHGGPNTWHAVFNPAYPAGGGLPAPIPGGRWVATCGNDGTARVWDATDGRPLTPRLPHGGCTWDAEFATVGPPRLLTGSDDRAARVWDLTPDDRPAADLRVLGELLSNRRLDATGAVVDLKSEEWQARWDAQRAKYPLAFRQPPPPPAGPAGVLPAYREALAQWAKAPPTPEEGDADAGDVPANPDGSGNRTPSAAERLGNMSWVEIRSGLFREAAAAAEAAVQLDPGLTWARANLAHALLLAGDVDRAKAIYRENKDARFELSGSETTFADAVKVDFGELRRDGVDRPEMAEVEAMLSPPSSSLP